MAPRKASFLVASVLVTLLAGCNPSGETPATPSESPSPSPTGSATPDPGTSSDSSGADSTTTVTQAPATTTVTQAPDRGDHRRDRADNHNQHDGPGHRSG